VFSKTQFWQQYHLCKGSIFFFWCILNAVNQQNTQIHHIGANITKNTKPTFHNNASKAQAASGNIYVCKMPLNFYALSKQHTTAQAQ
jgi:hypothetical protein